MSAQPSLDLAGGTAVDQSDGVSGLPPGKGELSRGDSLPAGPYGVGLTHTQRGDEPPYTVTCGDGRAVAGHVPSREIAGAIAEALNRMAAQ